MLKNNLYIGLKYFLSNKVPPLLNILGMMTGVVTFLLVTLEVSSKLTHDKLFKDAAAVYWSYVDHFNRDRYELKDVQIGNLSHPSNESEYSEILNFMGVDQTSYEYENTLTQVLIGRLGDPPFLNVWSDKIGQWVENFAYKTKLSYWIAVSVGLLTVLIALLRKRWQSWKVATRNPVEALRYE